MNEKIVSKIIKIRKKVMYAKHISITKWSNFIKHFLFKIYNYKKATFVNFDIYIV